MKIDGSADPGLSDFESDDMENNEATELAFQNIPQHGGPVLSPEAPPVPSWAPPVLSHYGHLTVATADDHDGVDVTSAQVVPSRDVNDELRTASEEDEDFMTANSSAHAGFPTAWQPQDELLTASSSQASALHTASEESSSESSYHPPDDVFTSTTSSDGAVDEHLSQNSQGTYSDTQVSTPVSSEASNGHGDSPLDLSSSSDNGPPPARRRRLNTNRRRR